jgi:phenylalanyl-tRNA synthetase beta chain
VFEYNSILMKLPLSWLKDYIDLSHSAEEIAEVLTLAGIEVDAIEKTVSDTIFAISLTPNLGHCLSIIGLCRELAALLDTKIKRRLIQFEEKKGDLTAKAISVELQDKEACPHYSCRRVRGVSIGPSPDWLKQRLEACGMRSVNNAVDVGNFVMLESGQPLHLFDYQSLKGKKLSIHRSQRPQTLKTLDEIVREIPEGTLLISDTEKPVAIAGVMGSYDSSVTDQTSDILIESAYFAPAVIRKAIKTLGLRTEGAMRHERGIDPQDTLSALDRCAQLLVQVAGGEVCEGVVDVLAKPFTLSVLECRPSRVNQLLGTHLSQNEVGSLLKRLEMEILQEGVDCLTLSIPSYRHDLRSEIDLIEEVGRIYGFNHIPQKAPRYSSSTLPDAPVFVFEEEMRKQLLAQGLQECLTCDLISPKLSALTAEKIQGAQAQISVLHPASIDQSILRTSLLPGLLQVVKLNLDQQNQSLSLFEVGHIHFKQGSTYYQQSAAAIVLSGGAAPYHFISKERRVDFFDLKGRTEALLSSLRLSGATFEPSHLRTFHPYRQARIKQEEICIGFLGEVHPEHLNDLGIDQPLYFAELNLHDLYPLFEKQRLAFKTTPLPTFPGSTCDWTVTLAETIPVAAVFQAIQVLASPLLAQVELIDLYKSEEIGKDKKNATFRFFYRDLRKTVESEEVKKEHFRLIEQIEQKLRG